MPTWLSGFHGGTFRATLTWAHFPNCSHGDTFSETQESAPVAAIGVDLAGRGVALEEDDWALLVESLVESASELFR